MANTNRKEADRKYRESHRSQRRAYDRKRQQLPQVKARRNETARQRYEAKVLAHAKGKPLRSDKYGFIGRAPRPKMLTELLLQEAENFCLEYDLKMEQKFDSGVLRLAARTIRDNPFYPVVVSGEEETIAYYNEHGITNPWYCTDYLNESLIKSHPWARNIRRRCRKEA